MMPDSGHLTIAELQRLAVHADSAGNVAESDVAALHLAACDACAALVRSLAAASIPESATQPVAVPQHHPPISDLELYSLAAGTLPDADATRLLASISVSATDAARLRAALADLDETDDVSWPLASNNASWQQALAEELRCASQPQLPARSESTLPRAQRTSSLRERLAAVFAPRSWMPAAGLAALALLVAGISLTVYTRAHSDAHLLAAAYDKQRLVPLRVPGGDPVSMASGLRGPAHGIAEPSELLELRLRAQQHLDRTPADPYWHQVIGRIDIQEGDGAAARRNLEFAEATDPALPGLPADLAGAWFELGENGADATAYARAANLYLDALQHPGADAALLHYNLALCWERQGAQANALDELHRALDAERSTAWRKAIQAEIDKLSAGAHDSQNAHDTKDADTKDATAAQDPGDEVRIAQAAELALRTDATHNFPGRSAADDDNQAIARAAALSTAHGDLWLADFTAQTRARPAATASSSLAESLALARGTQPQAALDAAHAAEAQFRAAQVPAGVLRAQVAAVFALQRLGRSAACRAAADLVLQQPLAARYSMLRAQTLLDRGSCEARSGDFAAARRSFAAAQTVASGADLPHRLASALTSDAEALRYLGAPSAAWTTGLRALQLCRERHCTAGEQYTVLYALAQSASLMQQNHVASELMRTAAQYAARGTSRMSAAYASEALAMTRSREGDFGGADQAFASAFASADAAAKGAGPAAGAALYRALWQSDQAELALRRGDALRAASLLHTSGPALLASDYRQGRLQFFLQAALTALARGDADEARTQSAHADAEAELALPAADAPDAIAARERWAREQAAVYGTRSHILLATGNAPQALLEWLRFQALPYAPQASWQATASAASQKKPAASQKKPAASQEKPAASQEKSAASQETTLAFPHAARETDTHTGLHDAAPTTPARVVVIARLEDDYVGWLVDAQTLSGPHAVVLGSAARLEQQVTAMYRLCADRDASLADVRRLGADLYNSLLAPLHLDGAATLAVDLDPSLASLPLPALVLPDGRWLAASRPLLVLPPWWSLRPAGWLAPERLSGQMRAVLLNGFGAGRGAELERSALARSFQHVTRVDGDRTTRAPALHTIAAADVFHFSGHAAGGATPALLLRVDAAADKSATIEVGGPQSSTGVQPESLTALTPEELAQVPFAHCTLAFLAACNTTATDPSLREKLPDLRNSLLLAGAHKVIASLWDVDDDSTQALAGAMYAIATASQLEIPAALGRAQQAVLSTPAWEHPFYWAGFEVFTR